MKKIVSSIVFSLVCTLLASSFAWAHDYWIKPETFHPETNSILEAGFTGSHSYFEHEETPDVTKFRLSLLTPREQILPLKLSKVDSSAAWSKIPVSGKGTYIVSAVSTRPVYWCKTKKGWKSGKKHQYDNVKSSGMYLKSIKTFFSAEKPSESYTKRLGHDIEIVPQVNPTTLKSGDKLQLSVFFQGKRKKGIKVFGIYQGFNPEKHSSHPVKTTTVENGKAELKLDKSGTWLVGAKHRVEEPSGHNVDYASYKSYIMFQVK